jgi:CHAT domain-containing protein
VSLPNIDLKTLEELSRDIVHYRPAGASLAEQQNYTICRLKPALRLVWNNIVVPVFNKIQIPLADATMPPQCRIWWYPTGPLSLIPIHAAGSGPMDVSRLVISSYVTNLQSLFHMRKESGLGSGGQQSFLRVSQMQTPGHSSLPQTMEELDEVAQVFRSSGWPNENIICLQGPDATVNNVSRALDSSSWVHFACHGSQDVGLGMQSSLVLHDGGLRLSEIASKRRSTGQFAFLSSCHSAAGRYDLTGEALHLAAGLQFASFPSGIATMWTIRDEDAPKGPAYTYQYLFHNGLQGLDPSEAAAALNYALSCLREDPSVTVDRWAPFIHFGI